MSVTAKSNEQFSDKAYWDQRYADETELDFDWFQSYHDLKEMFSELIPSVESRILILGCGNSTLSPSMYKDGYKSMINIDYSSTLISRMKTRYPEQTWHEIDILHLCTRSNLLLLGGERSFDIAIDKGTMDALMAEGPSSSPWSPSEKVISDVSTMLKGVDTLLKPGGMLIYITFGQPHFRKHYLEQIQGWTVQVRTLGLMFHYFVYICTKQPIQT